MYSSAIAALSSVDPSSTTMSSQSWADDAVDCVTQELRAVIDNDDGRYAWISYGSAAVPTPDEAIAAIRKVSRP
jgi:hypothetical protein